VKEEERRKKKEEEEEEEEIFKQTETCQGYTRLKKKNDNYNYNNK